MSLAKAPTKVFDSVKYAIDTCKSEDATTGSKIKAGVAAVLTCTTGAITATAPYATVAVIAFERLTEQKTNVKDNISMQPPKQRQ